MKKKYLVLGAGGSIDGKVVHRLLADGHQVFALVRKWHYKTGEELQGKGAIVNVIDDISN